ncbi:low-density lipoprotein receptor-related protein 1B-like [Coregonus clupeaformis]|uniref:low-density lipoprotein receptor-related protein 1B-like n=1 Tax=Coregonus clupeaformis TaxID=59861 RepID=UPI001E1C5F8B|nr:low-density lipoprotein receptor-related protein 1B-like [Coregonus clupeaformis]
MATTCSVLRQRGLTGTVRNSPSEESVEVERNSVCWVSRAVVLSSAGLVLKVMQPSTVLDRVPLSTVLQPVPLSMVLKRAHLSPVLRWVALSMVLHWESFSHTHAHASHEPILCDVGEFHCHDQVTCVPEGWLCDGEPDCPDTSDETPDRYPGDSPPALLIGRSDHIATTRLNGSNLQTLRLLDKHGSLSLDYYYQEEEVCWLISSDSTGRLRCAKMKNMNGFTMEKDIKTVQSLQNVEHMTIDWLTGNFYFVDRVSDRIFVCNRVGDTCVTIIDLDLTNPKGIAVDPLMGMLFFTDYGNVAKVERCHMDGTNRTRLVDYKTEQPTAVALDLVKKLVYWADAYLDYIEVVDYNGKNRHAVIQQSQVSYIHGLAVFENYLYATHSDPSIGNTMDIFKIHRFNTTEPRTLTSLGSSRGAIRVYHRLTQPKVRSHVCEKDPYGKPGGCSHICLLSGSYKSRTCRCRTGFSMGSDGQSCKKPKNDLFLFYGKGRPGVIRGLDMNVKSSDEHMVPIEDLVNPRAIDYHTESGHIYFADTTSFLIGRQKIDGNSRETILKDDLDNVEGISVDWIGNNLYWTNDGYRKTISVARLERASQTRKTLLEGDMSHPRAIVVDPLNSWMYWTDWEEDEVNDSIGRIEKAWMDGSNRRIFVTSNMLWPNGLTLDHGTSTMYWCDAYYDHIEKIHLNGTGRQVFDYWCV